MRLMPLFVIATFAAGIATPCAATTYQFRQVAKGLVPADAPPVECALPWGGSLANGGSVIAWDAAVASSCASETRTCQNGNLSGTLSAQNCRAPMSCKDLLANAPATPSGTYVIDVDGSGGAAPFSADCDMSSDGGGWTKIIQQYEAHPVSNWEGGKNGDSFTLSSNQIPTHTHVAFGKDNTATFVDYVTWTYSTSDITPTLVISPKTGLSYHVARASAGHWNYHNPEEPFFTGYPEWYQTLTLDRTGNRYFTWAFAPNAASKNPQSSGGYALGGAHLQTTPEAFAWTVWVR